MIKEGNTKTYIIVSRYKESYSKLWRIEYKDLYNSKEAVELAKDLSDVRDNNTEIEVWEDVHVIQKLHKIK